jgi:hypothetical protein
MADSSIPSNALAKEGKLWTCVTVIATNLPSCSLAQRLLL